MPSAVCKHATPLGGANSDMAGQAIGTMEEQSSKDEVTDLAGCLRDCLNDSAARRREKQDDCIADCPNAPSQDVCEAECRRL